MTQHIAVWLNDLAALTAGNAPLADSRAKVATMTAMLADEFPAEAFTRASLQHVASECKFFPAYAELRSLLARWWKDNKPTLPAIAGARLDADTQACVTVWLKRRAAGTIPNVVTSLDMLRSAKPAAFEHLVATDAQCQAIARKRGWLARKDASDEIIPRRVSEPDPRPRSQAEQLAALGIPPAPQPMTPAERFEATHGRKPGELSAPQLAAMRAAAKAPAA